MSMIKKVCAWCHKDLGEFPARVQAERPITHGICDECSEQLLAESGEAMDIFLDRLEVPVLLLGEGVDVLTGNKAAREILGKSLPRVPGERLGNIVECVYSQLPEGCGRTVHCRSCTVRKTVLETFKTGKSLEKIKAYPDVQLGSSRKSLNLEVTTQKMGRFVLLRIDRLSEGASEDLLPS